MTRIFTSAPGQNLCGPVTQRSTPDSAQTLSFPAYGSLSWLSSSASAGKSEWQIVCCADAFCVFLSWTLTPSSVAGFIINDVQIPHMKGSHCGPDKRLCVLSLSEFFSLVFSFPPRLASHILLVPPFSRHIFEPVYLKTGAKNVSKRVIFLFSTLPRLCVSVAFGMKKQPFVFIPSAVWTIGIFLAAATCLLKSISSLQASANSLHFLRRCESTSRISCKTYARVSWMLHLWTLNLFKFLCKNNGGNWPQLRVSPDLGTC